MLLAVLHRIHLLLSSLDIHLVAAHLDRDYGNEKLAKVGWHGKYGRSKPLELSQQRKWF
jgi:hypothetical protein